MGEPDEEQAWITQSQNGDPAAFEPLVRRYQRMIHALTYQMTGQQVRVNGEVCDVLINAEGDVLVVGSRWIWSSGPGSCGSLRHRIQAQPLEAML